MDIVNVNVEVQHGVTVVTFRGPQGEAVEVRLAPAAEAEDDRAAIARAREMLASAASFRLGAGGSAQSTAAQETPGRLRAQDVGSGSGYRGVRPGSR